MIQSLTSEGGPVKIEGSLYLILLSRTWEVTDCCMRCIEAKLLRPARPVRFIDSLLLREFTRNKESLIAVSFSRTPMRFKSSCTTLELTVPVGGKLWFWGSRDNDKLYKSLPGLFEGIVRGIIKPKSCGPRAVKWKKQCSRLSAVRPHGTRNNDRVLTGSRIVSAS